MMIINNTKLRKISEITIDLFYKSSCLWHPSLSRKKINIKNPLFNERGIRG